MAQIIKLPFGDELVDAVEVQFEIRRESWSEYDFPDGGRLRLKTCALRIFIMVDSEGNPIRDEDGTRMVYTNHDTHAVFLEGADG